MQPIGLAASLLWFGIPSLVFCWFILWWLPRLVASGMSFFLVFHLTFMAPLVLMLLAALVVYRREGNAWTWPAFRDRMRLRRLTGADWLWTGGLVVAALAAGWAMQRLLGGHELVRFYTHPAEFTQFITAMTKVGTEWGGISLPGNWGLLIYYVTGLFIFNILGEEFWWRGIILPRQELALGRQAWIVNGLFWAAFHAFYHNTLASFLGMAPGTLLLAYVCQRRQSTWPGIIAHFIMNSGLPIALAKGVMS